MTVTKQQINSMVRKSQRNDFAPVIYHVVDYRKVSQTVRFEPVRGEVNQAEIDYYRRNGDTVEVIDNDNHFADFFSHVYRITGKTAEIVYFSRWYDAAEFVKANYAGIQAARAAFYQEA